MWKLRKRSFALSEREVLQEVPVEKFRRLLSRRVAYETVFSDSVRQALFNEKELARETQKHPVFFNFPSFLLILRIFFLKQEPL